jgi:uncharacterized protein (TIGR03083 family)
MEAWDMVDNERKALADLADSMTPAQWDTQSLCSAWKVRDVVAHLNEGATITKPKAFGLAAKYGFRVKTMLEREAMKGGAQPTDRLTAQVRATIGARCLPPGTKPADFAMEMIVHQQDIRRAIGAARTYPADEMRSALDRIATKRNSLLPGKKRGAGLHLAATDLDWEHGDGAEVRGPAEAILMAMSGRKQALADLSGPGVDTLRQRIKG